MTTTHASTNSLSSYRGDHSFDDSIGHFILVSSTQDFMHSTDSMDSISSMADDRPEFPFVTGQLTLNSHLKSESISSQKPEKCFNSPFKPSIVSNDSPVTPTRHCTVDLGGSEPLTPTANLKILMSAASPEIRNRERMLEREEETPFDMLNTIEVTSEAAPGSEEWERAQATSRKEKSLGLLCQKFLARYPSYPRSHVKVEICLDEVARTLNVERRRIYDIINVLESVEMVSRLAKNRYSWHGKNNLHLTLARLKTLAETEGFQDRVRQMKESELNRDLVRYRSAPMMSPRKRMPLRENQENNCQSSCLEICRNERSLGIMSQKFLMLFLVSRPSIVNLDLAAKIIIGDPDVDKTESAKFKTKIRRLYDIANILTSLQLICKVHVNEVRGRKPAFKYTGPHVDDFRELSTCSQDGHHRPSSKHSLLDCIRNPHDTCGLISASQRKKFTRFPSFDQVCGIGDAERRQLAFHNDFKAKQVDGKVETKPSASNVRRVLLIRAPEGHHLPIRQLKHPQLLLPAVSTAGNTQLHAVVQLTPEQVSQMLLSAQPKNNGDFAVPLNQDELLLKRRTKSFDESAKRVRTLSPSKKLLSRSSEHLAEYETSKVEEKASCLRPHEYCVVPTLVEINPLMPRSKSMPVSMPHSPCKMEDSFDNESRL